MTPVSTFRRFVFSNRRPSLLHRLVIGLCFCSPVFAADLKKAQQFFLTGNYTDAERAAEVAGLVEAGGEDEGEVVAEELGSVAEKLEGAGESTKTPRTGRRGVEI